MYFLVLCRVELSGLLLLRHTSDRSSQKFYPLIPPSFYGILLTLTIIHYRSIGYFYYILYLVARYRRRSLLGEDALCRLQELPLLQALR